MNNTKSCNPEEDLTAYILQHIKEVNTLLILVATEFLRRATCHDESKLFKPEKELYDKYGKKINEVEYGSEEYHKYIELVNNSSNHHHHKANSHHPQHYENGIDGMDLFDLVEMFIDWNAVCNRKVNGSITKSIEINKKRFNLSEQLSNIFYNTILKYDWLKK